MEKRLGLPLAISGRDAYAPMLECWARRNAPYRRQWEALLDEPGIGIRCCTTLSAPISCWRCCSTGGCSTGSRGRRWCCRISSWKNTPSGQRLEGRGFFDQVALFPYLRIPHGEEGQVTAQALSAYDALGLPPLEAFSKV